MKTVTSKFFRPSTEPDYIHPVNGTIHDDALGLGMHFYQHMIAGHDWSYSKCGIDNLASQTPTEMFLVIVHYHFALKEGWIERDDSSKRKAKRVLDKWIKLNPHWIDYFRNSEHYVCSSVKDFIWKFEEN